MNNVINKSYLGDEIVFGNGDEPSSGPTLLISDSGTLFSSTNNQLYNDLTIGQSYTLTWTDGTAALDYTIGSSSGGWDYLDGESLSETFTFTATSIELWIRPLGDWTYSNLSIA